VIQVFYSQIASSYLRCNMERYEVEKAVSFELKITSKDTILRLKPRDINSWLCFDSWQWFNDFHV